MTPTDELIAALRARAANIDGHIAEIQGSDGSPYDVFRKELRAAADRLASLAAPVGEWETTAEEREALETFIALETSMMGHTDDGVPFGHTQISARLLRDLDRALASLSVSEERRLRMAEDCGTREAELEDALSAERDQNKRLVEVLEKVSDGLVEYGTIGSIPGRVDLFIKLGRMVDAALAQPEDRDE